MPFWMRASEGPAGAAPETARPDPPAAAWSCPRLSPIPFLSYLSIPVSLELLPPGLFAASGLTRLDAADCDLAALDGEQLARLSGRQCGCEAGSCKPCL